MAKVTTFRIRRRGCNLVEGSLFWSNQGNYLLETTFLNPQEARVVAAAGAFWTTYKTEYALNTADYASNIAEYTLITAAYTAAAEDAPKAELLQRVAGFTGCELIRFVNATPSNLLTNSLTH